MGLFSFLQRHELLREARRTNRVLYEGRDRLGAMEPSKPLASGSVDLKVTVYDPSGRQASSDVLHRNVTAGDEIEIENKHSGGLHVIISVERFN